MKILNRTRIINVFHSLRTQLILYYMVISFVVLTVGAYFSYMSIMDMLKRNNERYLLQQFSQADYNIRSVFNEVDRLSRLFLLDDDIQRFLQDNYETAEFNVLEMKNSVLFRISQYISNYNYLNSIYIYTENKGGIGGSDKYTSVIRDNENENKFFSSGMYEKVKESFPRIILHGGITDAFYRNYETGNKTSIISAARGIKPIYEPNRSATIVFNINERYIASIYASSSNLRDGYMYIIDGNGKIVSSNEGKNIGYEYKTFNLVDKKEDFGSFTANTSNKLVQGVYYKLKDTGWYLVGEMPFEFFTDDLILLQRTIFIIFTFSLLSILIVSLFWIRKVTKPLNIIAGKMSDVSKGNLGLTFSKIPKNEFGTVIKKFNEMSLSIVDLIKKNDEIQEEKRELEIEALQHQINPHFIYNTLNMIKWMAVVIKAKNIVDSVVALGNILKPAFISSDSMCSLREELEYLENYIKIISWRFNNSAVCKFDIEECFLGCRIPRFILQPIIENSITHGILKNGDSIDINIDVTKKDDILQIIVSDTGAGIESKRLEEINDSLSEQQRKFQRSSWDSMGLYNVNRRIRLNYGQNYGIKLENIQSKGVRVIVNVPMIL